MSRFADFLPASDEANEHPIPPPRPDAENSNLIPPAEPAEISATGTGTPSSSGDGNLTQSAAGEGMTITPVEGPANRLPKRRRLVITGSQHGGGRSRGPLATEDVTFKVVEAFENAEGRFAIRVNHLHGADGFGCDLVSVGSAELRDAAQNTRSIKDADILRYIEVKGSSSGTGELELTDNELRAAKRHGASYWLYRVYVNPNRAAHYEVAVLSDPLNSGAVRTVTRFDMSEGAGASWFTMVERAEDERAGPAAESAENQETTGGA